MLRAKLKELEVGLLPPAQDPLGNYGPEQVVRTRAYLILAHATFESYVEKACRDKATAMRDRFLAGANSRTATALLAHFAPPVLPTVYAGATLAERDRLDLNKNMIAAVSDYEEVILENNGIKQYNLIRLLGPVGVDLSTLSVTDLGTCDSFGEARGNLAHGRVHTVVDPFSEKNTVDALEVFFSALATHISALL